MRNATVIRQLILLGLLVVVAAAAIYDRRMARPGCELAHEKIGKLAEERLGSASKPLTPAEVASAAGKPPAYSMAGPNSLVEKYVWLSGLPWRSYYIWVVYSPGETSMYKTHYLNEELPAEDKPDFIVATPEVKELPGPPLGVGMGGAGGERRAAAAGEDERPAQGADQTKGAALRKAPERQPPLPQPPLPQTKGTRPPTITRQEGMGGRDHRHPPAVLPDATGVTTPAGRRRRRPASSRGPYARPAADPVSSNPG